MKSLRRAATWLTSALVAAMSVGGASPVANALLGGVGFLGGLALAALGVRRRRG